MKCIAGEDIEFGDLLVMKPDGKVYKYTSRMKRSVSGIAHSNSRKNHKTKV